jgi:formate hydrogenlyase subunit 3/multisubunit Na+/H+ antiporter MnhD subunit
VVGLAIPLVESGFVIWFPIAFWSVPLALAWLTRQRWLSRSTRALRIAVALALLPLLFIAVWEGGWFLIPADLAWLAVEVADRGSVAHGSTSRRATG